MRRLDPENPASIWLEIIFSLASAAVFLLLTSTCSPLYAFNDWVDPNCFMSMGKGMLNGLVPYRDLFEQKGPLIFLLHSAAYLIDRTGFLGVFVFEIINMTIVLLLAGRIARLFVPRTYSWFIVPAFACLTLVSGSFEGGDSAEEFSMALVLGLLYLMACHFKNNPFQPLTFQQAFISGILGGCVLMIKYTLLGSWLGFAAVLTIGCIRRRQFQGLLLNVAAVLAGAGLAVLPWIGYFGLNHAIGDFFNTYFWINITLYSQDMTLLEKIRQIGGAVGYGLVTNWVAGAATLFGIIAFSGGTRFFRTRESRLALPACLIFQILASYYGGKSFAYYYLALFPFLVFGLVAIAGWFEIRRQSALPGPDRVFAVVCSMLALVVATIIASPNIPLTRISHSQYPQYAFAEIINQVPGATVLNYGFLDGGFYTAADVTPSFKFFMLNNIDREDLPEMYSEQQRYIADREATFVVLRMNKDDDAGTAGITALRENYDLVAEKVLAYRGSGLVFKYALYRLRAVSSLG